MAPAGSVTLLQVTSQHCLVVSDRNCNWFITLSESNKFGLKKAVCSSNVETRKETEMLKSLCINLLLSGTQQSCMTGTQWKCESRCNDFNRVQLCLQATVMQGHLVEIILHRESERRHNNSSNDWLSRLNTQSLRQNLESLQTCFKAVFRHVFSFITCSWKSSKMFLAAMHTV